MKFLRGFQFGRLALRSLKTLASIDARLAEQNTYLARIADHIAPQHSAEEAPAHVGVDYLNASEAAVVLEYIDRTQSETGRPPTEPEIMRYLADEATIDLQQRMELGDR